MTKHACGALTLFIALAACQPEPDRQPGNVEKAAEVAQSQVPGPEMIACAVGGMAEFSLACLVEQIESEGTVELTVRHPDGGFRRFVIVDDGRGVAVADGAEEAVMEYQDGIAEVAIGKDRYRFPANRTRHGARP